MNHVIEGSTSVQLLPNLPFSMGIFGASQTGKTTTLFRMLLSWHDMFPNDKIRRIVVVQKFRNQPAYDTLTEHFGPSLISFTTEFDEMTTSIENMGPPSAGSAILVIDDCLHILSDSDHLCSLIVGGVHHHNITAFIIGHNLYSSRGTKYLTTMRNLSALCLMPNPRDMSIFSTLSRQLFPGKGKNILATVFRLATQDNLRYNNSNYPFLLVDCSPQCADKYRLKTGIGEDTKFCYVIE